MEYIGSENPKIIVNNSIKKLFYGLLLE